MVLNQISLNVLLLVLGGACCERWQERAVRWRWGRSRGIEIAATESRRKRDLHLSDLSALVVATEDGDSVLEAHFQSD